MGELTKTVFVYKHYVCGSLNLTDCWTSVSIRPSVTVLTSDLQHTWWWLASFSEFTLVLYATFSSAKLFLWIHGCFRQFKINYISKVSVLYLSGSANMSWKNKKAVSGICNTCLCVFLWSKTSVCAGIPVYLCEWAMASQERVIKILCLWMCMRLCVRVTMCLCEWVDDAQKSILSLLGDDITNRYKEKSDRDTRPGLVIGVCVFANVCVCWCGGGQLIYLPILNRSFSYK